jgi:hypothetical protein
MIGYLSPNNSVKRVRIIDPLCTIRIRAVQEVAVT